MIKIICDVCEMESYQTNNAKYEPHDVRIMVVSCGTDHEQGLFICAHCQSDTGIDDFPTVRIREALVEALQARLVDSVKSGVPDGKRPFDGQGETNDTSGPDLDLLEGPVMVPAVVEPVKVPTEAELVGVECKCGKNLTVDNWCPPGICTACFKKDLEALPVELVSETVA